MKNNIICRLSVIWSFVFCFGLIWVGCSSEISDTEHGGGWAMLTLKIGSENSVSKANTVQNVYSLSVTNSKGELVKQMDEYNAAENKMWFLAGQYTAKVESGKLQDAAFDSPYYMTEQPFTIVPDITTPVKINTKLANIKVSVEYSAQLLEFFSTCNTTVSNQIKSLVFSKEEQRAGYFKVNSDSNELTWNLDMESIDGLPFSTEGKIEIPKANDHYKIKFDLEQGDYESGGIRIVSIVVTEVVIPQEDTNINIGVKRYPEVNGDGFDIATVQNVVGNDAVLKMNVLGFPQIKSAWVTYNCKFLSEINDFPQSFDLVNVLNNTSLQNTLKLEGGIEISLLESGGPSANPILFDITALIRNSSLPFIGDEDESYSFTFIVTDTENKTTTRTLTFNKIDADVQTLSPKWYDIWAGKIRITGQWMSETRPNSIGFEYREGTGSWTRVENPKIDATQKMFSTEINGLKPATLYAFRSYSYDGITYKQGNVIRVTTETAFPLYNGGFNDWSKEGSAWYARPSSANEFWDSGNKGATTVGNNNPTEPEENDVMEGSKAASLTSKVIVGNFAAGNIFAGHFSGVDILSTTPDMTFGRPFSGRPTKLSGYYKYNSRTIDNGSYKGLGGKPDRFHLYIMITSSDGMPRRLNDKNKSPFDLEAIKKTGTDGTIWALGFAELTSEDIQDGVDNTQGVTMNEYKAFSIELTYFDNTMKEGNKKPAYIVLVGSASKYGDFFTGGKDSRLLLDGLTLEYD